MSAASNSCRSARPHLAELALGILEGRSRGGVLRHLDRCGDCGREAEQLAQAADLLVELAAPRTPPGGLERAVLARRRAGRAGPRRQVPRVAVAAALALLLAAAGAGLSRLIGSPPAAPPPATSARRPAAAVGPSVARPWLVGPTLSAPLLTSAGTSDGTVRLSGVEPAWLVVRLTAARHAPVRCLVRTTTGRVVDVGTFPPSASRWASALPVPADEAETAELVGPHGAVLARASLSW